MNGRVCVAVHIDNDAFEYRGQVRWSQSSTSDEVRCDKVSRLESLLSKEVALFVGGEDIHLFLLQEQFLSLVAEVGREVAILDGIVGVLLLVGVHCRHRADGSPEVEWAKGMAMCMGDEQEKKRERAREHTDTREHEAPPICGVTAMEYVGARVCSLCGGPCCSRVIKQHSLYLPLRGFTRKPFLFLSMNIVACHSLPLTKRAMHPCLHPMLAHPHSHSLHCQLLSPPPAHLSLCSFLSFFSLPLPVPLPSHNAY